jgi:PAS domain S-box-containing protein
LALREEAVTQAHDDDAKKMSKLRQRAEALITQETPQVVNPSVEELKRLLHELSVHQIELELQNGELRAAQTDLETSRRKYIDLYEFTPVGLLVLGQDARIQEPNTTFAAMLGITRHKLITRDFTTFIAPESQDTFYAFYRGVKTRQSLQQCEVNLLPLNQAFLTVRLEGVALAQSNGETTYRISVSDVTAQKEAESQRLELAAERHRIKVLADFVRDLSDDLRTPLTGMVTSLYMITKSSDKDAQIQKVEDLSHYLFQLNAILDQLQQMAVLDNLVQLDLHPEDLNRLITEVCQSFNSQVVAQKVKLTRRLDETLPLIPLDINHMDRAIRYVLENALRFVPQKGAISVETSQSNGQVIIEITDDGIGIEADILPHIFKRFFKTEAQHRKSGAGLGLPMAKKIVELHHGTIDVTSVVGIKTVVKISLPAKVIL